MSTITHDLLPITHCPFPLPARLGFFRKILTCLRGFPVVFLPRRLGLLRKICRITSSIEQFCSSNRIEEKGWRQRF